MGEFDLIAITCQIIIGITGCLSIWMIHDTRRSWRLAACTLALIGQPAWFYAGWQAHQWGILLMDTIATIAWARGFLLNNKKDE